MGRHRGRAGCVHAGTRRPARARRTDRGRRSGRSRAACQRGRRSSARFPALDYATLTADLTGPLDLPELDGLVAANSLHYVPRDRQVAVITALAAHLRPGGRFVVVEYDADRGNPWVPHPFSYGSWERLAEAAGLDRHAPDRPGPEPLPRRDLRGREPATVRRAPRPACSGPHMSLRRVRHAPGEVRPQEATQPRARSSHGTTLPAARTGTHPTRRARRGRAGGDQTQRPSPRRPDRGDLRTAARRRRRCRRLGGQPGTLGLAEHRRASGGTTTPPSNGGTTTPRTHTGTKADCPNMGGGTSGSSGSGGSSTTPSTTPSTAPTPAT